MIPRLEELGILEHVGEAEYEPTVRPRRKSFTPGGITSGGYETGSAFQSTLLSHFTPTSPVPEPFSSFVLSHPCLILHI